MNNPLSRLRCTSLLFLKPATTHQNQIKQTHAQLIQNGLNTPFLLAKLIIHYTSIISSESTKLAQSIFTHSIEPNLFLFNTLLRCTQPKNAIILFADWASKGKFCFDEFTYKFVFGACARFGSVSTLWFGRQVHVLVLKHGFVPNMIIETTLIHFYSSNSNIESAKKVFDEMPVRSFITWNAMITGYCSQKEKCDYNCEAFMLFRIMLFDECELRPTETTIVSILSAISALGVLETGASMHGFIEKSGYLFENDVFIGTGLIDMYSKCGCLDNARLVFELMREKNVLTWTAMGTGLALHGKGKEALELLDKMWASGVKPNEVTFTSLFSACCHVGLVQEGLHLFQNMDNKFSLEPKIQHYGCIVDLLGRAGHLEEAYEFITQMKMAPDLLLWRSLLSACKVHGNAVMGEKIGKVLLDLNPAETCFDVNLNSEDYVALSNVYASVERWGEVEKVRKEMKQNKIVNVPGFSSV